jgi:hypothetical protein
MLTIKKLKELIKDCPDDMLVVGPGSDHSYRYVDAQVMTALYYKKFHILSEDYGEETTPETKHEKRIEVLLIT